jgi:hypothetical protein
VLGERRADPFGREAAMGEREVDRDEPAGAVGEFTVRQ